MAKQKIHIVKHNGGWGVKKSGEDGPESTHDNQKEAVAAGKELALKEEADLVVHREDGTFQNVITFSDLEGQADNGGHGTAKISAHDVMSVGSRISWQAVFAGAVITLAVVITLGMLGLALGLTTRQAMAESTRFYVGAAWSLCSTMVALFIGGVVLSRTTVGEDKTEAIIYGVVLWGVLFALMTALSAVGAGLGYQTLTEQAAGSSVVTYDDEMYKSAGLTEEQVAKLHEQAEASVTRVQSAEAAWWAFGLLLGSIAAAVLGSVVGAGPELVIAQIRGGRTVVRAKA